MDQETITLLLDCLRQDDGKVSSGRLAALTNENWQALFDCASKQFVVGLLYHRLKSRELDMAIPDDILLAMQGLHRQNAVRNLCFYGALRQIVQAFSQVGIPVIALKGIYLAGSVYDNIALRELWDMDIMVPRQQLQLAAGLLTELGYVPTKRYYVEVDLALSCHLTPFFKKGVGFVEIHWSITHPQKHYHIAETGLWERAVPTRLSGIDVLRLSPEDLLLHLCVHTSYQHEFCFGLRTTCDIAQMIQHYGGALDWDQIIKRARQWKWERGVYLALRVARESLGAAVPEEVLQFPCAEDSSKALVEAAITQIFTEREQTTLFSWHIARTGRYASWWAKLRRFWVRLLISKLSLAEIYGLSSASPKIYLYYLVRLKDLSVKYVPKAWQMHQEGPLPTPLAERTRMLTNWLAKEG